MRLNARWSAGGVRRSPTSGSPGGYKPARDETALASLPRRVGSSRNANQRRASKRSTAAVACVQASARVRCSAIISAANCFARACCRRNCSWACPHRWIVESDGIPAIAAICLWLWPVTTSRQMAAPSSAVYFVGLPGRGTAAIMGMIFVPSIPAPAPQSRCFADAAQDPHTPWLRGSS